MPENRIWNAWRKSDKENENAMRGNRLRATSCEYKKRRAPCEKQQKASLVKKKTAYEGEVWHDFGPTSGMTNKAKGWWRISCVEGSKALKAREIL